MTRRERMFPENADGLACTRVKHGVRDLLG